MQFETQSGGWILSCVLYLHSVANVASIYFGFGPDSEEEEGRNLSNL